MATRCGGAALVLFLGMIPGACCGVFGGVCPVVLDYMWVCCYRTWDFVVGIKG